MFFGGKGRAVYLRQALAHDPVVFETKNEFWDYIYSELDIAELIDIDNPSSFCCVLHDDHNPSARISLKQTQQHMKETTTL